MAAPYDAIFLVPWAGPLLGAPGTAGGAETQIVALARGLAARGMRIGLVVIGDRGTLPREVDGVEVITLARPPGVRVVAGLLHDARTLAALLGSPSRVFVARIANRSVAVAALAARMRRARFVYSSASLTDFAFEGLDRAYNVRTFEWGLRAADVIVVQTEEQAELCRSRFGRVPVVIRSIAERAAAREGHPQAFLWIGRLVPHKRLDVYLDLAAAVPEARFQLIAAPGSDGNPELAERLERARVELGNLEVLDPRPRAELGPLIDRAVAIVSTGEREGMPNVFLEGWSRGVPALAFSRDPDGLVQRHGLGGFAGGCPERLAELARSMWASRDDHSKVAARCIEYVRREHDLAVVCAAWRDVLSVS